LKDQEPKEGRGAQDPKEEKKATLTNSNGNNHQQRSL
jgi:hypothetical protein